MQEPGRRDTYRLIDTCAARVRADKVVEVDAETREYFEALRGAIASMQGEMASMRGDIGSMQSDMMAGFAAVDSDEHRAPVRDRIQHAGRRRPRRLLHRRRHIYRYLLRTPHRTWGTARDVRPHVSRGARLRLAHGDRRGGRAPRRRGVDVRLRRHRRGAAQRRTARAVSRHESLRARRWAHRGL